jgi:hypothetical protein
VVPWIFSRLFTPRLSISLPTMPKKKPVTLEAAVERVARLQVNGVVAVQAALALQLAESFEQAPHYARARPATLLAEVEEAERVAEDLGEIAPRLLRQVADAD